MKCICIAVACTVLLSCTSKKHEPYLQRGLKFAEAFSDLPYLKTGTQTYQNSSTDPAEDQFNDHDHWLYTDKDSGAVLVDVAGPGCIYRIWSTGNDGDNNYIKIYLDGDSVPRIAKSFNQFHNAPPLSQKPQVGSGGDKYLAWWSYVPISFQKSCKIVRQGNFRPFFSITYHTYTDTTGVSTWIGKEDLHKMENMWNNPTVDPKSTEGNKTTVATVSLKPGQEQVVYQGKEAGYIAALKISNYLPEKGLRLQIYWDGEKEPSVDAPVKWFFGSVDNGGDAKALGIGTINNNGYCYFPMPFWKEAKVVLVNKSEKPADNMKVEVQYNSRTYEEGKAGYFYATANEDEKPLKKYTCLKTTGAGHVIGMTKRMPKGGHACEGDEVYYIDGRHYPDIYGTGEEDYNNNAWWTNSYNAYPTHGCTGNDCYYRLHYPDVLVFNQGIDMEFETWEQYYVASVVWYYKRDKPTLEMTDLLDVRNSESEKKHQYSATGVVWQGVKSGRYPGLQIYTDSVSDDGVAFTRNSQFQVTINPSNKGVRLRLRTDNGPMQIANVWVDNTRVTERPWKISKNRFVATWVDADFEIPQKYTHGKDRLTVKIEYSKNSQKPWSEYNYDVFSYVD